MQENKKKIKNGNKKKKGNQKLLNEFFLVKKRQKSLNNKDFTGHFCDLCIAL